MNARSPDPAVSKDISTAERNALDGAIRRALTARCENGKAGIAAALVLNGQVIATGENEVHLQADPTRHAEMVVITRAARDLGTLDLSDCILISTLQPCEMCLSAMRFAGIKRVIFDEKNDPQDVRTGTVDNSASRKNAIKNPDLGQITKIA